MQKVLITGGTGHLGRYVVDEFRRHHEVTVLDREAPPNRNGHIRADVLDLDAFTAALDGHHALVHLAAIDSGTPAPERDYFHVAVQGTWNALAAAEAVGVRRAAVCSSCAAYGLEFADPRARVDYLPLDEAHPLRPLGAYELGKRVVETVAESFARRGRLAVACLRPAWVMLPDSAARFDARARAIDVDGRPPEDDPRLPMLRPWVRPDDTARGFRLALEADLEPFDVFNLGARDTFSPAPTLDLVERAMGRRPEVRDAARFEREPRAAAFGAARAERVLGWRPTGDWAAWVAETAARD